MQTTPRPPRPAPDASTARPAGPAPNPNLRSLTGLRFLALLPVFLTHAAFEGVFGDAKLSWGFLDAMGSTGYTAVSFFFVLSGFVITWSYRSTDTARKFWRRRLFRVFPNHLVAYAFTVALMLAAGAVLDVPGMLAQLFLLQAWVPDPLFIDTGNTVTWSLGADVAFYALFPLLLALVHRIRPTRLWYWAGALVLVVIALPTVALSVLPDSPLMPVGGASRAQYWFTYFFPLSRAVECVIGMVFARIVLTGKWIRLPVPAAAALVVAAYALAQYVPFLYRLSAVPVVPLALLTAALAVADAEGRGTFLGGRRMVWLGELSFAFYLVHQPVLAYGHTLVSARNDRGEVVPRTWDTPAGIAVVAGAFVLSMALAWLLHNGVEKPAMRRWSRPRRPAAPPRPAGAPAT
ncbi:acyltransferase [Streptomyces sp. BHT-5-2]|uniref:acyltransferase family protein n=1 Tax=unclassified Streptomyces TaxID=2593676 RepID=UPI001C8D8D38|nr:acyltransferase [Streptomyces sp. BHT-5-2]QZL05571.1 acyltransferase [Streptomyces sp. BHT-5-2]